jgi:hypothetical protein
VAAGLIAILLVVDGVAVLRRGSEPQLFAKVGVVILPKDQDQGLPPARNRALPADLAELIPGPPDGYQPVGSTVSGPLTLDAAARVGQASDAGAALTRGALQRAGFVKGQGQVFASPAKRLVLGFVLFQFSSAEAARTFLSQERAVVDRSPVGVLRNGPTGVAFSSSSADGSRGVDSLYTVDQLVVREFVASPDHAVTEADLATIHSAVARSLSLS